MYANIHICRAEGSGIAVMQASEWPSRFGVRQAKLFSTRSLFSMSKCELFVLRTELRVSHQVALVSCLLSFAVQHLFGNSLITDLPYFSSVTSSTVSIHFPRFSPINIDVLHSFELIVLCHLILISLISLTLSYTQHTGNLRARLTSLCRWGHSGWFYTSHFIPATAIPYWINTNFIEQNCSDVP